MIAIEGLTINELDSNIDYLKRSKGLSVGYFQLSTVSSYLPNYMTYDENPMFAQLQLTPKAEAFENFAYYPSQYESNLGKAKTIYITFQPKWNHTTTRLALMLTNKRFTFEPLCSI